MIFMRALDVQLLKHIRRDKVCVPGIFPAGESIIWAIAKESGMHDEALRYPADSEKYVKATMDKLGL
jgi:hypothetical protein